jgi:hypothetical protein
MLWPSLALCTSVPSRMGDAYAWICVERGLGGIVTITRVAMEVWCHRGGMTGVMLDQSAIPMLLFTVHGHVCPIGGNGCCGRGPRGSPPCQRASRVPRVRQKYAKRVERSHAYIVGVRRGGHCSRRDAGVRRFDDIMGTRVRREASLSLE